MSDPQDRAEALDEDVVDTVDDVSGDEFGAGLPEYPPDELLGADEADVPDSVATRTAREEPETLPDDVDDVDDDGAGDVGALVDPAGPVDDESQLLADETDAAGEGPESAAIHVDPAP